MPSHQKGFTLVELVAVLVITSVLAVVAFTYWPGSTLTLNAQAEQLANDIRYTQTLSMTKGSRFCLTIAGNTYQIIDSATGTAVTFAYGGTTSTLGSGMAFGTLTPANMAMLVFGGDGVPYSSSSTSCTTANALAASALAASATIPLIASGQTRTVNVSPETGRVTVQ